MDKLLLEVLAETKYLSEIEQSEDYERFEALVELRQTLTDRIAGNGKLSSEQKKLVQEILQFDSIIMEHMHRLKGEAAEALIRLNGYKKQRDAYGHQDQLEGFMFDSRN